MKRFFALLLSSVLILPGIATSSEIVDKIMGLYFRVMKPTETSQISIAEQFSCFETSMGDVMLGMWFDEEDENSEQAKSLEKRFTEYISSCSREFAGSIFGNFIRRKINAPLRSTLEDRASSVLDQLLEIREKQRDARKAHKSIKTKVYPLFVRFGPVYEYLKTLRTFHRKPIRSFNILEDEREKIYKLAEKLRDCPDNTVKRSQTNFIKYIEKVQQRHGLTAAVSFELCKDAFYDIIDQSHLKTQLEESQTSLDLLNASYRQKLDGLNDLYEQMRML